MSMIIFCISLLFSMMFVNIKLMILLLQFTFFLLVEIIILLSEGARVGRNGIPRVLKRSQNHCKQTIQETQLVLAKPLVRYPLQKETNWCFCCIYFIFNTYACLMLTSLGPKQGKTYAVAGGANSSGEIQALTKEVSL